jgi:hypothetical protein
MFLSDPTNTYILFSPTLACINFCKAKRVHTTLRSTCVGSVQPRHHTGGDFQIEPGDEGSNFSSLNVETIIYAFV